MKSICNIYFEAKIMRVLQPLKNLSTPGIQLILIGFALLISWQTQAQAEKTKTFSGEYENLRKVTIKHNRGDLSVHASTDGKFRYEAILKVTAKEAPIAQMVVERFESIEEIFDNELELSSKFDITNWTSINGKTKIKFRDGTKVTGIKEISVDMVVYVPKMEALEVHNKYDDIKIHDDLKTPLTVNLHSGKLQMVDYSEQLNLNVKYSKVYLKNIGNAQFDIYDSDLELGNGLDMELKSKYSKYEMGNFFQTPRHYL